MLINIRETLFGIITLDLVYQCICILAKNKGQCLFDNIDRENEIHIPVLKREVIEAFSEAEGGSLIDCTLGYAGHSEALLGSYPYIDIIGIDRDEEAVSYSSKKLERFGDRVEIIRGRFSDIVPQLLKNRRESIVGLLADFGVSSLQLDKDDRGFSFSSDNRLDMRMDTSSPLDAYRVVNEYSQDRLEYILREYGEIKNPSRIVSAIIKQRADRAIESTKELADLATKYLRSSKKIHPATLLFQAVRIEVNDELGEIERLLDAIESNPPAGAVIALITFHSLEDRLVKRRFQKWSRECVCPSDSYRCTCGGDNALGSMPSRKPITAERDELSYNPRSRSAKLRLFKFKERL